MTEDATEASVAIATGANGARVAVRDKMQPLLEWVERIEERVSGLTPEALSILETLAAAIGFLTRRAMQEMMPEFRDEEIVSLLAIQFGEVQARIVFPWTHAWPGAEANRTGLPTLCGGRTISRTLGSG